MTTGAQAFSVVEVPSKVQVGSGDDVGGLHLAGGSMTPLAGSFIPEHHHLGKELIQLVLNLLSWGFHFHNS